MIENTAQLQQAIDQMGRMQRILESYRFDILPQNPRNFAVLAEGPLDENPQAAAANLRIPLTLGTSARSLSNNPVSPAETGTLPALEL